MSDIIYYNITMTGKTYQEGVPASFVEERVQPLIQNPDDYYLSVVRFSIDGTWIPIFLCKTVYDPYNPQSPNTTPYIITITYGNYQFAIPLEFIPESDVPIPNPPVNINQQDLTSPYYFVYYYSTIVTMLNNAIYKAFHGFTNAIINPNPGHHVDGLYDKVPGLSTLPLPYFIYDSELEVFSLIVPYLDNPLAPGVKAYVTQFDSNNYPVVNVPNAIKIFMNTELSLLIDGFDFFAYDAYTVNLMIIRNFQNNYYNPPNLPIPNTPEWLASTQQYNTIGSLTSIQSIVFTTNTIPVQHEYIPTNAVVGSAGSQSGNISFRNTLTDFIPSVFERAGQPRSRYIYNPTAQFRLISLKSNQPLTKIDLHMWWSDQYNNLYPLYVSYNQSNSVKLMFIKKSLINYKYGNI